MVIEAPGPFPHHAGMSKVAESRMPKEMQPDQIGRRLRILRLAFDLKPSEISDMLGMERTYWSRFETGKRPITNEFAYLLVDRFGVTLDWLVLGRWDKLSLDIAERLRLAAASADAAAPSTNS